MIQDPITVRSANVGQSPVLLIHRFERNPHSASRIWLKAEIEAVLMRWSTFATRRLVKELAILWNHRPNQEFREFADFSLAPPCVEGRFQVNTVRLL